MNFDWSFGDGGTSTAIDINHSYSILGTYDVRLIAISDKGCRDTITKQVSVVNYTLSVDFSANNPCLGDTTYFNNLSTVTNDSIINYRWNFGDGSPKTNKVNPKHYYSATGSYTVTLEVFLLSGNKDSVVNSSVTIFPNPVVTVNYTPGTTVYIGQIVTLSVPGTYDSILW